ncbi:MAG: hypothetical protein QM763_04280 [Agriterribacter sp.]
MQKVVYKGYDLHINPVVVNPNRRRTQTILIYKDGECVGAVYADIDTQNAMDKAKLKVDLFIKNLES